MLRRADGVTGQFQRAEGRLEQLQRDGFKQAEALINAQKEIARLQSELARFEVKEQQYKLDFDSKKIELEKEIVSLSKSRVDTRRSKTPVPQQIVVTGAPAGAGVSEEQRMEYLRRERELERRVEELRADLEDAGELRDEAQGERSRVAMQLEEGRAAFRTKLSKIMDDQQAPGGLGGSAKDELIRSYVEKENDLVMRIERLEKRLGQVRGRFKRFKDYARQLKHLAEDWAPVGQALPAILSMRPPVDGPDDPEPSGLMTGPNLSSVQRDAGEASFEVYQRNEIDGLRSKNRRLEEQVEQLQSQMLAVKGVAGAKHSDAQLQRRLLQEIEMLKGRGGGVTTQRTRSRSPGRARAAARWWRCGPSATSWWRRTSASRPSCTRTRPPPARAT